MNYYQMWDAFEGAKEEPQKPDSKVPAWNWQPHIQKMTLDDNWKGKGRFIPITIRDKFDKEHPYVILVSYNRWFYLEDHKALQEALERDYDLNLIEAQESHLESQENPNQDTEQADHVDSEAPKSPEGPKTL
jgi:hypothetical protein